MHAALSSPSLAEHLLHHKVYRYTTSGCSRERDRISHSSTILFEEADLNQIHTFPKKEQLNLRPPLWLGLMSVFDTVNSESHEEDGHPHVCITHF